MRHIDVHKLADGASFTRFHLGVLAWCAVIIICDGYDLAVAGIALPSIMQEMGVTAQSGGLTQALEVATVARLNGIGLYGGTMLEGGVGTAATAHVCATFADLAWGTELFGPLLLTQEVLAEPLVYKDFMLQVPTGYGLGVEVDPDKLRSMQRR